MGQQHGITLKIESITQIYFPFALYMFVVKNRCSHKSSAFCAATWTWSWTDRIESKKHGEWRRDGGANGVENAEMLGLCERSAVFTFFLLVVSSCFVIKELQRTSSSLRLEK
jgi:hypothetical protein